MRKLPGSKEGQKENNLPFTIHKHYNRSFNLISSLSLYATGHELDLHETNNFNKNKICLAEYKISVTFYHHLSTV